MGIQINKKKIYHGRTSSKSTNLYLNFLVKIYRFLSRKTYSKINETILRRLVMSRKNQPSISLSRITRFGSKDKEKTIVVVGKVLNDERILDLPKLSICALKISLSAKKRILEAGGNVYTLDSFAMKNPSGKNSILLRGPKIMSKKPKI